MNIASEYNDERWRQIASMVVDRDKGICCVCGKESTNPIVHLKAKLYSTPAYDHSMDFMATLCFDCHNYYVKNKIRGPMFHSKEHAMRYLASSANDLFGPLKEPRGIEPDLFKQEEDHPQAQSQGCVSNKETHCQKPAPKRKIKRSERGCHYDIKVDGNIADMIDEIKDATGLKYVEILRPFYDMIDGVFEDLITCKTQRDIALTLRKKYTLN